MRPTGHLAVQYERPLWILLAHVLSEWLRALHTGRVFGTFYSVLVALLGVVVTVLSITGAWIWWKKRRARMVLQRRRTHIAS
ncbi:PepSY domain-containing protein [Variovorax sp. LARHSF232]